MSKQRPKQHYTTVRLNLDLNQADKRNQPSTKQHLTQNYSQRKDLKHEFNKRLEVYINEI